MQPVSNIDHLVGLLRLRLSRKSGSGLDRKRGAVSNGQSAAELEGVRALAAVEGVDDRQLKRALVQRLLTEHFGTDLVNDAKFQQVVDRVVQTLDGDPAGTALLDRMIEALRDAARS